MSVWARIQRTLERVGRAHATVLDPANQSPARAAEIAEAAAGFGTDFFLVGGSTDVTFAALDATVAVIKERCDLPVVFFGRSKALSKRCDAILFMSILNSRNPACIVGEHAKVTPYIHALGFETISTGYVIVEPGMTVGRAADAELVPRDGTEVALGYALAAQHFGMRLLFLEAGSGAPEPVSVEMVRQIKAHATIPLLVSGGINTPDRAAALCVAGAEIIGTGTVAEQRDFERLRAIVDVVKHPDGGSH